MYRFRKTCRCSLRRCCHILPCVRKQRPMQVDPEIQEWKYELTTSHTSVPESLLGIKERGQPKTGKSQHPSAITTETSVGAKQSDVNFSASKNFDNSTTQPAKSHSTMVNATNTDGGTSLQIPSPTPSLTQSTVVVPKIVTPFDSTSSIENKDNFEGNDKDTESISRHRIDTVQQDISTSIYDAMSILSGYSQCESAKFPLLSWRTYDGRLLRSPVVSDASSDDQQTSSGLSSCSGSGSLRRSRLSYTQRRRPLSNQKMVIPEYVSLASDVNSHDTNTVSSPARPVNACHACVRCFGDVVWYHARLSAGDHQQTILEEGVSFSCLLVPLMNVKAIELMMHDGWFFSAPTKVKTGQQQTERHQRVSFSHLPTKPKALFSATPRRNTFDSIQTPVHKKKSSKVRPLPRLHDLSDDSKVRSGSINTSRDPCPEDFFKFHKVLGVGSYGKVHLATFRETGDVVAIKVQLTMHRRRAETEVRVLTIACQSPFLVALHSHFSTMLALYLVEDYVPGGKLTEMMKEPFSMPALAFYSGQLVLALDYLHEKGILYRDLKPDNVLLTEKGYLKLCDFGSCSTGVLLNKVKVSTGTPRYWAPEKFLQKPYGLPSDWWSLGIIVYQMLMAKHPFGSAACGFEAYKNSVIKTAPHFKATICPYAVSMCEGLLEKDPEERLGGSAQKHKVFCHPFFLRHISWRALRKQEIRPPPMYRRVVSMPAYRE